MPDSNKTTGNAFLGSGLYGPKYGSVFYYYLLQSIQWVHCFFCCSSQISPIISVVNLLKTVPEFRHNFQLNFTTRESEIVEKVYFLGYQKDVRIRSEGCDNQS